MDDLLADLAAEHDDLDEAVAGLPDEGWDTPTPAEPWTVRDQVVHLLFFDGTGALAATDPDRFDSSLGSVMAEVERAHEAWRARPPSELLAEWRAGRAALLEAFAPLDPEARLPWYGPPMGARSFVTARLMETWAHGQDVVDALGVTRTPTDRLRHVAHIGVRARAFAYRNRGLDVPAGDVRVELVPPGGGQPWTWGDESATDVVRGPALDFCLLVTQRRHPADTDVVAEGPLAEEWLTIAQAFAGPPGPGRKPGQFRPGR